MGDTKGPMYYVWKLLGWGCLGVGLYLVVPHSLAGTEGGLLIWCGVRLMCE